MPEKMIRVRVAAVPQGGFFRAGRKWPHEQTDAEVTEQQFESLKAERLLSVVVLPGDPEEVLINGVPVPSLEYVMSRGYARDVAERIVAEQRDKADAAGRAEAEAARKAAAKPEPKKVDSGKDAK